MKDSNGKTLSFGQWVKIKSKLVRGGNFDQRSRTWDRVDIEPVEGIYIGWRTLREGVIHGSKSLSGIDETYYEDNSPYLSISGTKQAFLVVTGERSKPFYTDHVEEIVPEN